MSDNTLHLAILAEATLRLRDESLPRIIQCLDALDTNQLWYTPHHVTNSVGNLVLHLSGNIRQYLCSGIGGLADIRQRDSEFVPNQSVTTADLKALITGAIDDGLTCVNAVPYTDWLTEINVQVFTMSRYSALIHVIEHTSYHVGQITHLTKAQTGKDTGYYDSLEL